jgi:hypothetical protein
MAALQASGKCSHTYCMLRFPDRPDALPLDLIWGFETTSAIRRNSLSHTAGNLAAVRWESKIEGEK